MTETTGSPFLRRSAWLVGILVVVTGTSVGLLQWLTGRTVAVSAALADRQVDRARAALASAITPAEGRALAATVPTESLLDLVYTDFESLAARYAVTLRYNFSDTPEKDPTLLAAEAARDSWVIPIDFLGPRSELEKILIELEQGPYHMKLHRYHFDVTDSNESVLATTLILYGQ